jgi:hypothetical protein
MTISVNTSNVKGFGSKTDVKWRFRTSYARISNAIRMGRLSVHLIDNKIQIDMAEAAQLFGKARSSGE